ncbi:hypothetical protein CL647_00775 [bacterium]|nr:hypothetical protein [Actinomycetota bacterium]MBE32660.1 hypothetical protein [bacterium]|tara:strand:- start:1269 stop:2381 length:1113 start_codon:yes stop_codon:yes gene_type:complete
MVNNSLEYYLNIAGVCIKIISNNEISNLVADNLNAINKQSINDVDIVLNLQNSEIENYEPSIYSAKGNMNFNKTEYYVDYLTECNYLVKNIFHTDMTEVTINTSKTTFKKELKGLFKNKNIMTRDMILSYYLFWYILYIELLNKNKAFIHAGIFEKDNKATIITGTGGCGKTSTLFKILENETTKYISEDFGIVDIDGNTYFNPKPISIYATDIEFGQSLLNNALKEFSLLENLQWTLSRKLLKRNPMCKSKPKSIMGNRIAEISKIKNVLYFIRTNTNEMDVKDIAIDELAERVSDASMRELKTLNELLLLLRANAPSDFAFPSFDNIRKKTKEIYLKNFSLTNNKIVKIPYKTSPGDLVSFLNSKGLI